MNIDLTRLLIVIPPWIYGVLVTAIGQWGAGRLLRGRRSPSGIGHDGVWSSLLLSIGVNFVFLSVLPLAILALFQPLLPFTGARAGLALAVAVFLFGLVPARLSDVTHHGWDYVFWVLLIDLVRVGGALTLIGWLLNM